MRRIPALGLGVALLATLPAWAGVAEENVKTVRSMIEAYNRHDLAALDALVAAGVRRHSSATPGVEVTNLDELKAFLRADWAGVPDARQELHEIFGDGELVAVRASYRGTQSGPMGPFPPSGREVDLPLLTVFRLEEGKVAEFWIEWDNLVILKQIGAWPPPAPPGAEAEEANKALARRWFDEVINERNLDALPEIYAADYAYHGAGGFELRGLAPLRGFAASILAASDDRHATVERQVVEGDRVVTQFTSRGTQTGPFQGRPATGEEWVTEGIVISRIENGRIAEDWEVIHDSRPDG